MGKEIHKIVVEILMEDRGSKLMDKFNRNLIYFMISYIHVINLNL